MKRSKKQMLRLIIAGCDLVLLVVIVASLSESRVGAILAAIGLLLNTAAMLISYFDVKKHPEKDK